MPRRPRSIPRLLAAIAAGLAGCGEAPLRVLCSVDPAVATPLLDAFAETSGQPVEVEFIPAMQGQLEQRLAGGAEGIDLIWSASAASLRRALAGSGVSSGPPTVQELPGPPRVAAFAETRVAPHEVPATWMDLTRERWRDRLAVADPRWLAARSHLGAMKASWDRRVMGGYFEAVAEGLAENRVLVCAGGDAEVLAAIREGRADLGIVDLDLARSEPGLAIVLPGHDPDPRVPQGGAWSPPRGLAVASGERAEASQRLARFIAAAAAADAAEAAAIAGDREPLRDDGAAASEDAAAEAFREALARMPAPQ